MKMSGLVEFLAWFMRCNSLNDEYIFSIMN
jgi:hypothetical protein